MIVQLIAQERKKDIKASQLRKSGWIPASLYGKHISPLHIQIELVNLKKCLSQKVQKIELKIAGKTYLAAIEEIQKGALHDKFEHVAFHALNQNEKAFLTIPVVCVGKAKGQLEGGIVNHPFTEITVKGFPKDIPDSLQIDVSNLELGESIKVKDYVGKFAFEFHQDDMERVFATCHYPKVQDIPEAPEKPVTEVVENVDPTATPDNGETADSKEAA